MPLRSCLLSWLNVVATDRLSMGEIFERCATRVLAAVGLRRGNRLGIPPGPADAAAGHCGLVCLAAVAANLGEHNLLKQARAERAVSTRGMTAYDIIQLAKRFGLKARGLRVDVVDLGRVTMPCILHWGTAHFVVLTAIDDHRAVIFDPSVGTREYSLDALTEQYDGVTIEVSRGDTFQRNIASRFESPLRKLIATAPAIRSRALQVVLLAVFAEGLTLMNPLFLQWTVDRGILGRERNVVFMLAISFAALVVLQTLAASARSVILIKLRTTLNFHWRSHSFMHVLKLPMSFFEKAALRDTAGRLSSIERIENTLTGALLESVTDVVVVVAALVIMFVYSALLSGIVLVAVAVVVLSDCLCRRPAVAAHEDYFRASAKAQLHLLESIGAVRTIKLYRREEARHAVLEDLIRRQHSLAATVRRLGIRQTSFRSLVAGLQHVAVLSWGGLLAADGRLTLGALMAFIAYTMVLGSRVPLLLERLIELKTLNVDAERFEKIASTQEEPTATKLPRVDWSRAPAISFSHVRFRYALNEPHVLDGVTFDVESGDFVVVTGPSGCGKTTLLKLLVGVLPLSDGDIRVCGFPIGEIEQHCREWMGVVLQDDVLLSGSIADNISFFGAERNQEWMGECARIACIHDEISAMPMGYETLVGQQYPVLSDGQKQRVLLARALYKRPTILVLDGPMSHLDAELEQRISDQLARLSITRLVVAHRQESISMAHRRIVLGSAKDKVSRSLYARERSVECGLEKS